MTNPLLMCVGDFIVGRRFLVNGDHLCQRTPLKQSWSKCDSSNYWLASLQERLTWRIARQSSREANLEHIITEKGLLIILYLIHRGRRAFSCMTNNNIVCTRFEPAPILIHTHVMLTQDIVVIHSTENCHLGSGSCPHLCWMDFTKP